jgi:hypothetical protein
MNRKMFVIPLIILMLVLTAAPVMATQPKVWTEKNNEKFETFTVKVRSSASASVGGDWQYIPSQEDPEKIVVSWNEVITLCEITIDGVHVYNVGTDFTYAGRATVILYDPVINPPTPPVVVYSLISNARMVHMKVDYMYDFSAVPGGIEGTLRMQAILTGDGSPLALVINSLSGTGDLQNVMIHATSQSGSPIVHTGIVSGWPE